MKELFGTALHAAQIAGKYIQDSLTQLATVDEKGRADLVTNVDKTSENIIMEQIQEHYPDHSILAEESGESQKDEGTLWVIDPLDGTSNFVHGYPKYAVSIAVQVDGETQIGIVYDPWGEELFSAMRGEGAYLNQTPIQVSKTTALDQSLLGTGLPYEISERWYRTFDLFKLFYARTHGVRRDGSAALDLCYVASGRLDGFWEYDLHPWDVAAGLLIAKEAGGVTTNFSDKESSLYDTEFLATNGRIHEQMLEIIKLAGGG